VPGVIAAVLAPRLVTKFRSVTFPVVSKVRAPTVVPWSAIRAKRT